MPAQVEGQVLGDGQRDPGRRDPLDERVVGRVEDEHEIARGEARVELEADHRRVRVRDAHGAEDDRERLVVASRPGLRGNLGRQLQVGKAADREDRQLLPADERGQPVDRGHAGEDHVPGGVAPGRVERAARDLAPLGAQHGRAAVERLAEAVADAPEPGLSDRSAQRRAGERHARVVETEAAGAFEDLDDGDVAAHLEDDAVPGGAGVGADLRQLVPPDALDALDEDERALDRGERRVRDGGAGHASCSSRTSTRSPSAATSAAPSGGVSSRARTTSERSTCSIRSAGTPRSTSARHRSCSGEHEHEERRLLRGGAVDVVRAQGALLEDALPEEARAEQDDPLAVGKRRRRRRAARSTPAGRPRRGGRARRGAARPSRSRRCRKCQSASASLSRDHESRQLTAG